jgi:hypothetical protein
MIPKFRLLTLLNPPIIRLLAVQVLYDPYVQAPDSPASSNQKAAQTVQVLYDPYVQAPDSPASSNQKAADSTSTL